ncbi:substrate-binding periplasmic protein [Aestuariispira insulae]|uniref:Amino acid ABC transporter substrate-binding protein (PAAT family) n=1 Tax=Aestuariispira insulae TaxID=1461337 RepID=A0A3D9H8N9_9PROT|nr:transporter substrate-binding domain-containing protein [Aestuariispira insulae]RED45839.1 amino acid ABC transporter substrate-binding protein (PAAT family) [Aestuariispira insulae]
MTGFLPRFTAVYLALLFLSIMPARGFCGETESCPLITLSGVENNDFGTLLGTLITEIYREMGYDTEIIYMPGKRGLSMASAGRIAGVSGRVYAIGEQFPTLVRVPTPFTVLIGRAFTDRSDIHITDKTDLHRYRVGSLRGIIFSDDLLNPKNQTLGDSVDQLFRMLIADRIDLALITEVTGTLVAQRDFAGMRIHAEGPVMASIPVYHYLHESRKDLVPKVDAAIQSLKARSRLEQIRHNFLGTDLGPVTN